MELITVINQVIASTMDRILRILSTAWGWAGTFVAFAGTWVVSWLGVTREMCLYLVFAAIVMDLAWGIASSVKRKIFTLSIGFTKTGVKLAVYLSILTMAAIAEKVMADDWSLLFRLTSAVLTVAEAVSICGHILIVKPDTPVIRLLWKVLRSEIARKMGVEVADIEEFINQNKNGDNKDH
ncbi:MAG: phage holin family protein [Prevotella sp.]|jgi:hypothetical protein|nr:phage holin family protein [Prevotella sp.]